MGASARAPAPRSRPVILAADDDPGALDRIATELRRRYGSDYRVLCEHSATDALARLEATRADDEPVALVLADQWMPDLTGAELLASTKNLHPQAKRGLLIDWGAWGDRATADAILRAMALGHIDYYVLKPWASPDEFFHRTVTEFLHEWARTVKSTPQEVAVVGRRWAPRCHELRSLLARNGVPHVFYSSDSADGRRLLDECGQPDCREPVVKLLDGRVLVNPSNAELASAYGVNTHLGGRSDFDVVVVGAGPAGLAAAVYGSSEGLSTLVVERESIGGQAGSSSRIRNYLGFSRGVSGAELAQRAYQQAWVFGTSFLLMRKVVGLRPGGERHVVKLSDGTQATARAVILATGVSYRRLSIPALEPLNGAGVFYGASVSEAQALAGEDVYVVGGGNSAGQAAMHLCRYARQVTVLVRGPSLAASMSQYLQDEIAAAGNVEVRLNTEAVNGGGDGRLEHLTLCHTVSGERATVPASALFILIGTRPHTEWLPDDIERNRWGYVLIGPDAVGRADGRWPLERPPLMLETSLPGVFAVGDARDRSVQRVASAVGDGSIVIQQVHEFLAGQSPGRPAPEPTRAGA
jgi:thioredoxin reductase (NADPH)